MENFDYNHSPQPARKASALVFNVLTVVILITTICLAGVFISIFINPNSGLNPFPPPTLPVAISLPSATPTFGVSLPPTWTPVPTKEPTATYTPRPTATLPPTETAFPLAPQESETPAPPSGGMPFILQSGSPVAIANIAYPESGCDWLGVAGQVFDLSGAAVPGQQVQMGGVLAGSPVPGGVMITLTGLAPQYGPGYFEFTLGDKPVASKGTLWIQLLDQTGLPMSEKVYFDTYDDCQKNLIVINFKQVR
jgi:hypothetical protein